MLTNISVHDVIGIELGPIEPITISDGTVSYCRTLHLQTAQGTIADVDIHGATRVDLMLPEERRTYMRPLRPPTAEGESR